MRRNMVSNALLVGLLAAALGCNRGSNGGGQAGGVAGKAPTFSLAWSEYPSWSVFGVAHEKGLIHKDEGELGEIEQKWGVDIVLNQADYDPCLTMYGSGSVDAVCMTNMDSLAPSLGRESVAILPTSTSVGADACIVVGINSLQELKGTPTYGLEKSVSQYAFERNLELEGLNSSEFPFVNMDPAAAATAMQSNQESVKSIMVWNPFVLQTLRDRQGSTRLFDSSRIPQEIIDMVVIGKDSLEKPGGEDFACAVIDTFYRMNELLEDPQQRDEALVALGAKFSSLELEDMKQVVKETRFYKTPEEALSLFDDNVFQTETMPKVVEFCVNHDIVDEAPTVGFGDARAQLNFDPKYIQKVQSGE